MDVSDVLTNLYGYKFISWLDKPNTFLTQVGKKKLSYWRERDLLEYHLNFRDRLFSEFGILCNRMIRTLDGFPYIQFEEGYLTVHDYIEEQFSEDEYPEMKGYLLASLLGTGDLTECPPPYNKGSVFPFRQTINALTSIKKSHSDSYSLLVSLIPEVKKRLSDTDQEGLPPLPYLDHQLKGVMGQVFFEASDEPPQPAYKIIQRELVNWQHSMNRREVKCCFGAFVNGVDIEMNARVYQVLIAPWEWRDCILSLQKNSNVDQTMARFSEKWEAVRLMIRTLQLSIEDRRVSIE
ncbi:MAG: hypothetical protein WCF60_18715 [Anaerobacillus sp.]